MGAVTTLRVASPARPLVVENVLELARDDERLLLPLLLLDSR